LDLYAGTGALGLEAVSRGAVHATLVERGRDALAAIAANVDGLGLNEQVHVARGAVESVLSAMEGAFDLVFVDPPYADVSSGVLVRVVARLVRLLSDSAIVVVEHASSDDPPDLPPLAHTDSRRYGDTTLSFYECAERLPPQ
jgi:16S rRNA (guanine966-N2)-methyltransferase